VISVELSEGKHSVRVERSGYRALRFWLNVSADSVTCEDAKACENVSITKRDDTWYVHVTLLKGWPSFDDWLADHPTITIDDVKTIIRAWLRLLDLGFTVTVENVKFTIRRWIQLM